MTSGTIKRVISERGFGFILSADCRGALARLCAASVAAVAIERESKRKVARYRRMGGFYPAAECRDPVSYRL